MLLGDSIDLAIREKRCRVCRNGALLLAFALAALIAWQDWNGLFFLLPAVVGLYAAIAQISLYLIGSEVKRRAFEEYGGNALIALDFREKRYRACRNGALFLSVILTVLIGWQNWNRLFLILPAGTALYAAIAQVKARLIAAELKRRTSED